MAFFRSIGGTDAAASIAGAGVYLRAPQMSDFEDWAALREASRAFLVPWEPTWPPDDLTRAAFRRRLRRYAEDRLSDLGYPYFLFRSADSTLLGGVMITNIRRGVAQTGTIGYWTGQAYAGRGYMSAGVAALAPFAFDQLRLRRLEAACIPTNAPSIRLLEKCGFQREGLARQYLCINGLWQDHLLFARLAADV